MLELEFQLVEVTLFGLEYLKNLLILVCKEFCSTLTVLSHIVH